jgi:hypothetical protein
MWINVEDFYAPRSSVIGLQFETPEEFERGHALVWKHSGLYSEIYRASLMIVVRKSDSPLFREAGLTFTEVELLDLDALPPEEAQEIEREMVQEGMKVLLERLRREQ